MKQPEFLAGMKPVLLQGAMELETAVLRQGLTGVREVHKGNFSFWQGTLGSLPVVVSRTGIGTAAAGAATALGCALFQPALVLSQGTAGGYGELHPYDLVLGSRYFNANALYTAPSGDKRYLYLSRLEEESDDAAFTGTGPLPDQCSGAVMDWLRQGAAGYTRGRVVEGLIASSDQWNADPGRIAQAAQLTQALCEEMETAAAGETAARFGVPFGAVRVISNNNQLGESFQAATAEVLAQWLLELLKK